jgi:hypothetical protein
MPTDPAPPGRTGTEGTPIAQTKAAEDELLDRVRAVARRITERVRKALEDTTPDPRPLPADPTSEIPPS